MEILDVVDGQNRVIGQAERDEVHEKGLIHRSVGVLIFRDRTCEEMAIQRRGRNLRIAPNRWADTAGHVPAGASLLGTIRMEVQEEMFHDRKMPDLEFEELFTFLKRGDNDTEFRTMYRTYYDGNFSVDGGEVEEWRWVRVDDLLEDMREHPERYTGTFHDVMREYGKFI